jgi:hypothetical protein
LGFSLGFSCASAVASAWASAWASAVASAWASAWAQLASWVGPQKGTEQKKFKKSVVFNDFWWCHQAPCKLQSEEAFCISLDFDSV